MFNKSLRFYAGLIASVALGASTANAQLPASTYQFSALGSTYTEITGTAVTGSSGTFLDDDRLTTAIPLGFTFNYCGTDYTQIVACSNGWASFNLTPGTTTWTNSLSDINTIKPALMPLFDDLAGWGTGAAAAYTTTGTAPNRIFTFQFKNWNWRQTTGANPVISFQFKLYETTNVIEYIYRQETNTVDGGGATIGIGDNQGTAGYLVLNNSSATPTVSSTTLTTSITTKPATGQLYRFTPVPALDTKVDSVIVNTPFCSNSTQPVSARLRNLGTATITADSVHWSVDGVQQPSVVYNSSTGMPNFTSSDNYAIVALGNVFFPDATPRVVKAWTSFPNGLADMVPANDSATGSLAATLAGIELNIEPQDTTICQGDALTLDAGTYPNNPIYIWSNGTINQTLDVTQSGTYSVKVQNNMGCFDRDTVYISVHPDPVVNSIAIIDNGGGTFTFNVIGVNNVDSFEWNFDDGTIITDAGMPGQQIHSFTQPGLYTVTLRIWNMCNELIVTRIVEIQGGTNGISNLELQKDIRVFPNPSRNKITVSTSSNILMRSVGIYNLLGQNLYKNEKVNAGKLEVDVTAFASGIYNVVIETDKGKITKKLEVIK